MIASEHGFGCGFSERVCTHVFARTCRLLCMHFHSQAHANIHEHKLHDHSRTQVYACRMHHLRRRRHSKRQTYATQDGTDTGTDTDADITKYPHACRYGYINEKHAHVAMDSGYGYV